MTNVTSTDAAIEVFQDLDLTCAGTTIAVADVLKQHARPPWRHAPEFEAMVAESSLGDAGKYLVFERTASGHLRAARLVLYRAEGSYRIANIVPTDEGRSLGERGYNDVLNDFVEWVLKPCEASGVSMTLTSRLQRITDWTSPEAAEALRLFSAAANKSTGASHPMDAERWRTFLIADHRAKGTLSSDKLRRWLVEVEHWPEEEAWDLIIERENALELLEHYDHIH